jgi:hypothetical protein
MELRKAARCCDAVEVHKMDMIRIASYHRRELDSMVASAYPLEQRS